MSSLPPPPIDLHRTMAVTNTSFEDVHDAHVQAVLDALSEHRLNWMTAKIALASMIAIAEVEGYQR